MVRHAGCAAGFAAVLLFMAAGVFAAEGAVEFGCVGHLCEGRTHTLTATVAERFQQGDEPEKTIQKNLKGVGN